jgi:hypothetical protein
MSDLTSLLLYILNAPTWTARKLDKKTTADVKAANDVKDSTDVGNFNKLILPDCKELKAISSHIGGVRNTFYLKTAPWGEARGTRVGKAEDHMDLMSWFGDEKAKLDPLLKAFEAEYPAAVAKAEYELHGLFNAQEYPPWEHVENKFGLRLSVQPLPNANDVRMLKEIPKHVKDEIEASLKAEFDSVQKSAVRNAVGPLLDKLHHMVKQLQSYDAGEAKKLYVSLTENVAIMAEAAKRLNISRDPTLDALAEEAIIMVDGLTQEELKTSDGTRKLKTNEAEALAEKIGKLLGE